MCKNCRFQCYLNKEAYVAEFCPFLFTKREEIKQNNNLTKIKLSSFTNTIEKLKEVFYLISLK